ncbi:nucleotidyltransferase domain-containing protein [Marinicrinis sediminis]|uniref:Nucleotidyltransferase domain-containing protein n=1 Tax=Marinicrinis sediminis TaxID=1652465 RepID=A0ABW5RF89_9BACL
MMQLRDEPQLIALQEWMKNCDFPWWVAGGWSIDLFLNRKTREHQDVDVVVLRQDLSRVLRYFESWRIEVAIPGEHRLVPVRAVQDVALPRFGLHLTQGSRFLELLVTEMTGDQMLYRRNKEIRLSVDKFTYLSATKLRSVTPEWQLLFKSKSPREQDHHDFEHALSALSMEQKNWLIHAIRSTDGESEWMNRIEETL